MITYSTGRLSVGERPRQTLRRSRQGLASLTVRAAAACSGHIPFGFVHCEVIIGKALAGAREAPVGSACMVNQWHDLG